MYNMFLRFNKNTKGWQLGVVKADDTEQETTHVIHDTQGVHQVGPFTASVESCLGCMAEDH